MKDLHNISVVGLGLLGGSIALAVQQRLRGSRVVGYSHRAATRAKARELGVAAQITDELQSGVRDADLVILATPIFTFDHYFAELTSFVPEGCVITDVGSTKVLPHEWAESRLDKRALYVGSHPVAGSEQRGVEFARDDLFDRTRCILTRTVTTDGDAVKSLEKFWSGLGCFVEVMSPAEHDRVFANISHLPHVMAAGLVNASDHTDMKFAGKGFLDSTRIASGPSTVWADVLLGNGPNIAEGIDRVIAELSKLQTAIKKGEKDGIKELLEAARKKRASLIKYKIRKKELL
ncbi:MAG: prephenate dehydrogenase/arogenate dehydrogenase family protein [Sedimentisphaerales bacterium]|nr:prephenate dehydrogenase/arogenate dehydrogenase family protein [Sedimentisphaerales bacterium]